MEIRNFKVQLRNINGFPAFCLDKIERESHYVMGCTWVNVIKTHFKSMHNVQNI